MNALQGTEQVIRLRKADRTERALQRANQLVADGRGLDAIEVLTAANRKRRDHRLELRLVTLRQAAFDELGRVGGPSKWPPPFSDLFADVNGMPEVDRSAMTVDHVRSGVLGHGSVIVRGLLSAKQVGVLAQRVRTAIAAQTEYFESGASSSQSEHFVPVLTPSGARAVTRQFRSLGHHGGGCLAADSPSALFDLIEALETSGLSTVVEQYLGERPALSIRKTTLRDVPPDSGAAWHQDGAFLGDGIRTLNIWIALTPCGADAPSLDMVPFRVDRIAPTGTDGAVFDWTVGDSAVAALAGDRPPVRLQFEAGDAILFDEMNLHRTAADPSMTRHRLAVEAWCFAPSHFPMPQLPLVL